MGRLLLGNELLRMRLTEHSEQAFEATRELQALPETERALYTGAAKAVAGVPHFTPQEVRALSVQSAALAAAFAGVRPIRHVPGSVSVSVPPGTRLEMPARLRESLAARVPTVGRMVAGAGAGGSGLPQNNTHAAGASAGSESQADAGGSHPPDSGSVQARWKPTSLPPLDRDFKAAAKWRALLKAQVKPNPVRIEEVVSAWTLTGPGLKLSQHKVYAAAQTLLDMLPPDLVRKLRPFDFKVYDDLLKDEHASYIPRTNTIHLSEKVLAQATPEQLRGYIWHELGHWLYFNAHLDARVFRWRVAIDQHWRDRTQGRSVYKDPVGGWHYVDAGWISSYVGKKYAGRPGGIEIPSMYLEKASYGPEEIAKICRIYPATDTFKTVLSIFRNAQP